MPKAFYTSLPWDIVEMNKEVHYTLDKSKLV